MPDQLDNRSFHRTFSARSERRHVATGTQDRAPAEPTNVSAVNGRAALAIESTAAAIDHAALCVGPIGAPPHSVSLPRATWHALVRSRRTRVFDWMIDGGFRLLNVLPRAGEYFLDFAERQGLQNKYAVAHDFWIFMRDCVDDRDGWLDAIAAAEVALLELREPRPWAAPPERDTDLAAMTAGARLIRLDPEAISLHIAIPNSSLPSALAAAELERLRSQCPRRPPAPQSVLFLPGHGDEPEGRLIQIEDGLASALADTASGGWSVATLRDRIGSDIVTNLIELGALSRCQPW
jgi:hypothetical protein